MRFGFIATEKACYPVALICRVLQVSRAGYYAWQKRPVTQRNPALAYPERGFGWFADHSDLE